MIPFLDLSRLHASIRGELDGAFDRVVTSSSFILGREVADFETALAAAHSRTHAVGCGSGTDALALSLRALGIGPGDEVIVPAMTFIATAEAVVHVGATPVLADVDADSLLLSPETVADVQSEQTRAVIPVHLYGNPVPVKDLEHWKKAGLVVLEDAAQAHLADDCGHSIGTVGAAATLSFYPGKNLGAMGDAGAILTDDDELAARLRRLRDHGRSEKHLHCEIGFGARIDALQAALMNVKLTYLPRWTEQRRAIARQYRNQLAGTPGLQVVPWSEGAVHHLVCIRLAAGRRAGLADALRGRRIGSGIHYPVALSGQPSLAPWTRSCPEAERAADELLSLPVDPLMTSAEVDEVCAAVLAYCT